MIAAPEIADLERALSLAYAPGAARDSLAALWALDEQLGAIVAGTENSAAGQMRLTWWHDALQALRTAHHVDPILVRLAAVPAIDPTTLLPLVDGWEVLLDPLPLPDEALAQFAEARGATLFRTAGTLLGDRDPTVDEAGRLWALVDLAFRISDRDTAERALALALAARVERRWPRPSRALGVLAVLARRDARRGLDRPRRQGSPARLARALLVGLTGL